MPATIVELRPDRHLLDNDFEGYKLNLQALPHWSQELAVSVDKLSPDEAQYSFLHAKLFGLQNHLISDQFDYKNNFYYVDEKQQVRRLTFMETAKSFDDKVVYDVPANVARKPGHFHSSITFPTNNLAVIGDGAGYLHIVSTPARIGANQTLRWMTEFSTVVLGLDKYFVILDCRAQTSDDKIILHCLLQSIDQNDQCFHSTLTWVTYEREGQEWKQTTIKQLQGKGIIHYAAIETSFSALYIASDNQFKFTSDSEREIVEPSTTEPQERRILYTWLQTSDDITITLKLPVEYDKKLFHINVTPLNIKLSYAGNTLLDGKLKHKVDSELTTWNIENGKVDVLLTKSESMHWDDLVQGGDLNGEQVMDPTLVEEVHQRLMHLCSETEATGDQAMPGLSTQGMEECDAASEEDTVLVRFDATNHQVTHRIPLSVHQYLFTLNLDSNEVPAIVLRHDVDGCVWQPYAQLVNSDKWPMKHQGTLSAFGYIQSSKTDKKFIVCPPNFAYSVVCEAARHIFIYTKQGNSDCQLRQRRGGVMSTVKVGHQHVFNVDKYGEVLGVYASNSHLFMLTEKHFLVLQVV